jgi:hypothetical protein
MPDLALALSCSPLSPLYQDTLALFYFIQCALPNPMTVVHPCPSIRRTSSQCDTSWAELRSVHPWCLLCAAEPSILLFCRHRYFISVPMLHWKISMGMFGVDSQTSSFHYILYTKFDNISRCSFYTWHLAKLNWARTGKILSYTSR